MENVNGRLKTHIDGFDRILEGGVPTGHIVLLAGTPGTMKSSLSYYMLYNHALENNVCSVYVTLEQSRESLLRQMEKMGMHTDSVKDQLNVLDLGIIRKKIVKLIGQEFRIEKDGAEIMRIYGNFVNHDYSMEVRVQQVASVHRKWVSIRDQFGISMMGPVDPRLVIGATIVIEHIMVEEERERK